MDAESELGQKVAQGLTDANNPNCTDINVAALVAALERAGVSRHEIGEAMLGTIISIAREDPDRWISALYAAGVIVARNATQSERAN